MDSYEYRLCRLRAAAREGIFSSRLALDHSSDEEAIRLKTKVKKFDKMDSYQIPKKL